MTQVVDRSWRHTVALRHRVGALKLKVDFELTAPWTVLFAPSGGGKTTVLRVIAGLLRPDAGRVVMRSTGPPMGESSIVLTDTAADVFVAPHRREVRLVAQQPALFPHRSVLGNIIYGMPGAAADRSGRQERLQRIFDLCRVAHLQDKMPGQLSGGERQRVALARTLAAYAGRLLMLDEPFTGLEAALRADLIRDLRDWCRQVGTPVLMVTHDVGEVFAAEAEVLRMEGGRIVAQGPAAEVLAPERTRLLGLLHP